jgi:hypothetical protein
MPQTDNHGLRYTCGLPYTTQPVRARLALKELPSIPIVGQNEL